MPVEMVIPFALDPGGLVAMVEDPYSRASQRVKALVGSRPTERVMDSRFGVPFDRILFEPDDDTIELELRDMVEAALATYEPGVELISIEPEQLSDEDGIASVKVDFRLTEDPINGASLFVNTATINTGGTVKEVLRG